jgi:predicted MPP superfamily phosphohydrolase
LLTHQPIALEKLRDFPIDLELAWHTHRGQFYWMRKIVEWMNDYAYWEYKLWNRAAFVSQWIWTRWLPFRLWTQSEMVIINLKKK